jgi:MFS family permease
VIGLAFGPLLGSPLSEMLGRRSVYLFTIPVFGLFSLGAGLARNTATIMICRFLAGFFGGPVIAIGPGTLADMYTQENRAFTTTLFSLSPFLATAIG